uniref:Uncharacterized protein n=1 Tax=Aegilops tauschii subsp. strangulata TaxID=200361 RepID=A0A453AB57_AEGTS
THEAEKAIFTFHQLEAAPKRKRNNELSPSRPRSPPGQVDGRSPPPLPHPPPRRRRPRPFGPSRGWVSGEPPLLLCPALHGKQDESDRRRDAEAAAELPSPPIPVLLRRRLLNPAAAPPPPP